MTEPPRDLIRCPVLNGCSSIPNRLADAYRQGTEAAQTAVAVAAHRAGFEQGRADLAAKVGGRMSTDALTFVTVESPEDFATAEHNEYGAVVGYTADPTKFPSPAYAEAFQRVMDDFDSASCALCVLLNEGTGERVNMVGWVLHEDDEFPAQSGTSWKWATFVGTEDGVVPVCEDCAPENLYAAAASRRRPPPPVT